MSRNASIVRPTRVSFMNMNFHRTNFSRTNFVVNHNPHVLISKVWRTQTLSSTTLTSKQKIYTNCQQTFENFYFHPRAFFFLIVVCRPHISILFYQTLSIVCFIFIKHFCFFFCFRLSACICMHIYSIPVQIEPSILLLINKTKRQKTFSINRDTKLVSSPGSLWKA